MTPARLAIIYPSADPLYFWGCQLMGTLAHIWWGCPRIRCFWRKFFNLIRRVTGCEITRSPEVALLNSHIPKISKYNRKCIHVILLGAKLTIAKAWKQPSVSINAVKRKVAIILSDTAHKFETIWEPWAQVVEISIIPGAEPPRV